MSVGRSIAIGVIGILAFILLMGSVMQPSQVDSDLRSIAGDHSAANVRAQGAPQQQVVNGWTAHEYLELIAEQQARSERTLAIGLAAIVLLLAVGLQRAGRPTPAGPPEESGQPAVPPSPPPPESGVAPAPMAGQPGPTTQDSTFPRATPRD